MENQRTFTLKTALLSILFLFLITIGAIFILSIIFIIVFSIFHSNISTDQLLETISTSPAYFMSIIFISELIIFFIGYYLLKRHGSLILPAFDKKNNDIVLWMLLILFTVVNIFPTSELENLFTMLFGRDSSSYDVFNKIASLPGAGGVFASIVLIAAMPAFCEEFLFRGVIQNHLSVKYGNTKSIFITSFLFALVHLNLSAFLSLFLISLFLGYVYAKTKNLLYPMMIHFLNNALTVLLISYKTVQIPGLTNITESVEHIHWIYLVPSTIITFGLLYIVYRYKLKDAGVMKSPLEQ